MYLFTQNLQQGNYLLLKNINNQKSFEGLEMRLLADQLLSHDQVNIALIEQKRTGKNLEKLLIEMGFITEKALSAFISKTACMEKFSLSSTFIDAEASLLLPRTVCEQHKIFLTSYDKEIAYLAMVDIHDVIALDAVQEKLGRLKIQSLVATESELIRAIDLYFGYETSLDGILREIDVKPSKEAISSEDLLSPAVRLANAVILDAVKKGASDIHFEPEGSLLRIRYRIDGLLILVRTLHINHWPSLSIRLKVMASMNIADMRLPQNGRFSLHLGARNVDFRVSSHPIAHGENLVIRILDKSFSLLSLEKLGYGHENVTLIKKMLKTPAGMIIITGPTGSGKTTSLYSMLDYINSPSVNIMTLEDPIEYQLSWIRQTEIKDPGGITFSSGVRSILRQDPDIVFIGEVRDEDTAAMALRSSMTGHQVFTTLHANDVFGVVYRLQDLRLDPSILAGNMIGAIAQRLIRKLCAHCKVPCSTGITYQGESLGAYESKGCKECHYTGYAGRTAVVEILHFTESMNDMISSRATRQDYKATARENGFFSMVEHGLSLVETGITDLKEFELLLEKST